ncbi:MAG TPA: S8 family serine peptidase [Candidatus Limnocylindrales bacterium]|nr:S8 family serine peptidase [Candidatus Limnocylindrales bacterium]
MPNPTSRRVRATVALVLSAVLAIAGVAGTWAAPRPAGLDAPIRAFGWPSDGVPNDPYFGLQTDLAPIGVGAAWTRTTGAPGLVVAVLDTGIDAANPEFAGRLVPGYNALTGVADGPGSFEPTDDDAGHGTHVSGTLAAAADNGMGIAGIAPGVSLMPIKVLSADGEGDFGGMADGMTWAIAHGARIITMSLGGSLSPEGVAYLQHTFDAAHAAGAVVIAASGNDGGTVDQYPCNFTYVICVGSTTNDGTAVSAFSTRTEGLALVAPGEAIASTLPGGGYGYGSGTSMATPHVTGAVALLRSLRPTITPDEVMASLTQSAKPLVAGGHNAVSGYGLLQVAAAVDLVGGTEPTSSPTPAASPSPSASPTPSPTPDPGATPAPSASPTPDPSLAPVPSPVLIVPAVTASSPRNGARSVTRSVRPRLTFSVPMVGVSTRTVTMKDLSRGRWVTVRVSYIASTRTVTIVPASRLAANHSYRITVARVLSANEGTPLSRPFVFTFRTGYR